MKFWLYEGRHGERLLFPEDGGFERARAEQDEDNRITLEEILEDGGLAVSGSEEAGEFSIDDGGSITLLEVQ